MRFLLFKAVVSIVGKKSLTYNQKLSKAEKEQDFMVKKHFKKSFSREKQPIPSTSKVASQESFDPFFFDSKNYSHAELLQNEGTAKLERGEIDGVNLFDAAASLDPENHDLLYKQGLSLFQYGSEAKIKKYLLLANKKFAGAVKICPEFFAAWHSWGACLFFLGKTFGNHHFFLEAKSRYEKAMSATSGQTSELLASLYWSYGRVMNQIAKHSGEISDLYAALDAHAKATSHREDLPASFWRSFGETSLKIGIQINDIRLYHKAINCHKNAISQSLSDFDSWYQLSYSLMHLYYVSHDEDHFNQANECFASAAKLNPQNAFLWKDWAKLLLSSGMRLNDRKRLCSCIEKCHRSYSLSQDSEKVISIWARALAGLGLVTENLNFIHDALNKLQEGLDHFGETLELNFAHGCILFAKGKFFDDIDYYYQAVEKFQEGLSINRACHKLWFQLGYTYSILAEIEDDISLHERAIKFYNLSINLQARSTYLFQYARSLARIAEVSRDQNTLEKAILHYEQAFSVQRNTSYVHPEWLMQYGLALDAMGDFVDEEKYYIKAIEVLSRVLVLDPDFPNIHYQIALVYSHLGELSESLEVFERSLTHFKIASTESEENENVLLDWGLALINTSEICHDTEDREHYLKEAEFKLIQAAKLGASEAFYHLSSLYSLLRQFEKALAFLEKAEHFDALPSLDEILEDDWMENFRMTEIFQSFLHHLESKQSSTAEEA